MSPPVISYIHIYIYMHMFYVCLPFSPGQFVFDLGCILFLPSTRNAIEGFTWDHGERIRTIVGGLLTWGLLPILYYCYSSNIIVLSSYYTLLCIYHWCDLYIHTPRQVWIFIVVFLCFRFLESELRTALAISSQFPYRVLAKIARIWALGSAGNFLTISF